MRKEYFKFFPLLIVYFLLIVLISSDTLHDDEVGYVLYANRISQGTYYSQADISLWWGPGYPVVLTPFVYWKLPLITAKLLNSLFLFGATIYFYKSLSLFVKKPYSTVLSFVFGLYPPLLRQIHLLYTECLVLLLICGFTYHICKMFDESRKPWFHLIASAIYLGYLALTKVFFGYVILTGILLYLFLSVWNWKDRLVKTMLVYVLALTCCIPYLIFTYSVTGKLFYWGTSGGMSLYWMSSPYKTELGDWISSVDIKERQELLHHKDFFESISNLSNVEKDEVFKKRALDNIVQHPLKFLYNWVANIGRLLFQYPFSYTLQKINTYFYIGPNMFIVVLLVLSIYPAILRYKSIPYEIYTLVVFDLVAFGGTSLLSAYTRQFSPLIPIIFLWLAFVYFRILKIKIRPETENPWI